MPLDFTGVKGITIPQGNIKKITQAINGVQLWPKNYGRYDVDEYTVALLHFDDENDPWKDECGNTWTATGSPTVNAENAKVNKAMGLNGSSYLSLDSEIALGGKDFTIDFWGLTKSNIGILFGFTRAVNDSANRELIAGYSRSGASFYFHSGDPAKYKGKVLSLNRWYHFAIVYQHGSSSTTIYVDGISIGSLSGNKARKNYNAFIGYENWPHGTNVTALNGGIDEFRISDGIARWTSNFTPPGA